MVAVRRLREIAFLSFALTVGGGIALGQDRALEPAAANAVVATVDGRAITADALRRAMVLSGADYLPAFSRAEKKEELVESLVRTRILAEKARAEGMDEDPEIAARIDGLLAEAYWRRSTDAMQVPEVTIADAKMYYHAHREEFRRPVKVRGAVLVLRWSRSATDAERDEIRARSRSLAAQATGSRPAVFQEMIQQHSTDPATRRTGGDTGFVVEGTTVFRFEPPVTDALFEIDEVGGVELVETERGMHIVRLRAREGGDVVQFDLVAESIRRRLSAERKQRALQEAYVGLRRDASVEIHRDVLRTVGPSDLAASVRPPSFPVGPPRQ